MVELDVCREISSRYGLPLQFVMKDFRIMDILSQIQIINSKINANIIFKGGTAINKIYFEDVSRFSEDLDFDEISSVDFKKRVEKIKSIVEKINGYEIDKMRVLHKTFRFDCFFENELNQKDHIRLEFFLKYRRLFTAHKLVKSVVKSNITNGFVSGVLTYSLEDILARKLHALHDRTEGKDLYDIDRGLNKIKEKRELLNAIKATIKAENLKVDKKIFLSEIIEKLKKTNIIKMKRLTNNYIPVSARPTDWNLLRESVISALENLI